MEYVFFTMNNFTKEGGGTIRMYGILNELAKQNNRVTLISNAKSLSKFDANINHIFIDYGFDAGQKRVFQGLASLLPASLLALAYTGYINKLKAVIADNALTDTTIFFCEYLDNTIGYVLKKLGVIKGYINDLHGIATLEFKFQADHATSFGSKIKYTSKYHVSDMLDKKVFENASGFIFASSAMKQFFTDLYPAISNIKSYIVPYVLSPEACDQHVDVSLRAKLVEALQVKKDEIVLLFSGAFKKTGGVPDLIMAFANLTTEFPTLRLLLVGDGPNMAQCLEITKQQQLEQRISFVGRTSYTDLRTYQDLADIIVCPDKMNMYSELIVHVKYLDALVSGKIVVNGTFKSVKEINKDEVLSVDFEPSDVNSLTVAIKRCITDMDKLKIKYLNNPVYACSHLTYRTAIKALYN